MTSHLQPLKLQASATKIYDGRSQNQIFVKIWRTKFQNFHELEDCSSQQAGFSYLFFILFHRFSVLVISKPVARENVTSLNEASQIHRRHVTSNKCSTNTPVDPTFDKQTPPFIMFIINYIKNEIKYKIAI